jgi:hypothetical protein
MYSQPVESKRRQRRIIAASALAICLLLVGRIHAQDGGDGSSTPAVHPFAFALGSGDSAAPETKVYDLRIPMYITLIPVEDRPWGLRLKVTAYAGIYNFTAEDAVNLDFRFQSLAATPGVEFLVPAGKGWLLKPFTEIGYAYDFDDQLGFGVWSVGMRTLVTWPIGKIDLSFGTKVQYLSTFTSDLDLADDFGEVRLGLNASHPLPFTIGGNQSNLSLYFIRRQYIDAFIARDEGTPLEIQYSNELGFAFDTTPKVKLWFFKLPRIGLGYRWGQNIRGLRLNFGFPF